MNGKAESREQRAETGLGNGLQRGKTPAIDLK